MDFVRRRFSQGGSGSDDESKSMSSSISEGTSRFFNSVVAKKNGLLNNISSKIESVGTLMKTNSMKGGNSPMKSGPDPRYQHWEDSKDRLYAGNRYENADRRSNHSSGGYSDSSWNGDEQPPTSSNINISFDEPLYSPTNKTFSNTEQFQNTSPSNVKSGFRNGKEAEQYYAPKSNHGTNHKIVADVHSEHSNGTSTQKIQNRVSEPMSSADVESSASTNNMEYEEPNEVKRAPKFTTTKRRSSTVDEMLFDDYVPPDDLADKPEVQNGIGNFKKKTLIHASGDLMSFDDDFEKDKELPTFQSGISVESSEYGGYSQTSVDSSDNEFGGVQLYRTASMGSENSWSSSYSIDSQPDDLTLECMGFMKGFVEKIFKSSILQEDFGLHYFATVLFECNEAEDFSPAKTLMNMCFTFYHESSHGNVRYKNFLYSYLREQPIWQSLRFWNAAFFDAIQCERSRRPVCTRTFTCNMRAFGLQKELCLEFLRKQSTIANVKGEQLQMLKDNCEKWKEH
ncbi:hypothetical protein KUTeg_019964 [Tegillarca granosa]|uniref:SBF1/SBF2 domain-containing protein n=1 Tax=Tegillarca granosa TaxID=220873 RepID=A0ABQ9EK00_TEGGR|nr:hypothetical protein KUTeg_019964 [Tegillarca granosa]